MQWRRSANPADTESPGALLRRCVYHRPIAPSRPLPPFARHETDHQNKCRGKACWSLLLPASEYSSPTDCAPASLTVTAFYCLKHAIFSPGYRSHIPARGNGRFEPWRACHFQHRRHYFHPFAIAPTQYCTVCRLSLRNRREKYSGDRVSQI